MRLVATPGASASPTGVTAPLAVDCASPRVLLPSFFFLLSLLLLSLLPKEAFVECVSFCSVFLKSNLLWWDTWWTAEVKVEKSLSRRCYRSKTSSRAGKTESTGEVEGN